MPDDWDWFWAGEGGRDNLLRGEVEGLYREASKARSQAARLSSQLAKVQGSLETRLTALATAFDAYVELGDVREQLAGYPDTSAVRRNATVALQVLTRGGIPERLPAARVDYWLTDAVNAVIAIAAGTPDPDAEARAVAADRDAELFLVVVAGAIGRGATVAGRVPPLLVTDSTLSDAQRALWAAVLAGEYGDVLPAVHEPWRPALEDADADWRSWVRAEARASTPVEILRWIDQQVAASVPGAAAEPAAAEPRAAEPGAAAEPAPVLTARTGLGTVALALVGRGLGDEVALLERARELRARIETPGQTPGQPRVRQTSEGAPSTVVSAVRAAFLTASVGSPLRAELLTWVRPGLLPVVDGLVGEAESVPVPTLTASTPGGALEIATGGATADQRAKAERRVHERFIPAPARDLVIPAVVAAVLLVVLGVALALGSSTGAVLAGLGAVIAAVMSARTLAAERRRRRELHESLEATQASIAQAEARVATLEQSRSDTIAATRRLASGLRERLSAPVG